VTTRTQQPWPAASASLLASKAGSQVLGHSFCLSFDGNPSVSQVTVNLRPLVAEVLLNGDVFLGGQLAAAIKVQDSIWTIGEFDFSWCMQCITPERDCNATHRDWASNKPSVSKRTQWMQRGTQ